MKLIDSLKRINEKGPFNTISKIKENYSVIHGQAQEGIDHLKGMKDALSKRALETESRKLRTSENLREQTREIAKKLPPDEMANWLTDAVLLEHTATLLPNELKVPLRALGLLSRLKKSGRELANFVDNSSNYLSKAIENNPGVPNALKRSSIFLINKMQDR